MARETGGSEEDHGWEVVADPDGGFSTGIGEFDRLLGAGLPRGGLALFETDSAVSTEDLDLLLTPTILNFLHQSRGMIAILPARDSPKAFRQRMIRFATPRRFDARVRLVDYVGEGDDVPYVVRLGKGPGPDTPKREAARREESIKKMVAAEKAAAGLRGHPFIELNAFEVLETYAGAEKASRMFLFGIKRSREAGNLVLGILRPGLACADSVRSMADQLFTLRKSELGLEISGSRPRFSAHLVVASRARGPPYASLIPAT